MEKMQMAIKSWGEYFQGVYEFLSFHIESIDIEFEVVKSLSKIIGTKGIDTKYLNGEVNVHYNQIKDEIIYEFLGEEELIIKKSGKIGEFFSDYVEITRCIKRANR